MKVTRHFKEPKCSFHSMATTANTIACSANGDRIKLFDAEKLAPVGEFKQLSGTVREMAFMDDSTLIAGLDSDSGDLQAFDIRTGKMESTLLAGRPVHSISINSDKTLFAAGTELRECEAHVVFWDIRNAGSALKVFNEVHSDDISQVKFHPISRRELVTGSTDGIVNLLNLDNQLDEDESLRFTIPLDSVHRLGFFGPSYEYIYTMTHIETFSLHRLADVYVFPPTHTHSG